MTTLAYTRFRYRGASLQACVGLSKTGNEESEIGCRPLQAGPDACCRFVVLLAKGADHCLHMTPRGSARQTPAEWPYNYSEAPYIIFSTTHLPSCSRSCRSQFRSSKSCSASSLSSRLVITISPPARSSDITLSKSVSKRIGAMIAVL